MGLHAYPTTAAERFALHLELNYGLQLDTGRHQALVAEINAAFNASEINAAFNAPAGSPGTDPISAVMEFTAPKVNKSRAKSARQKESPNAEG